MAQRRQTTVSISDELRALIEEEARKYDMPWTKMLTVLAREALEARMARVRA